MQSCSRQNSLCRSSGKAAFYSGGTSGIECIWKSEQAKMDATRIAVSVKAASLQMYPLEVGETMKRRGLDALQQLMKATVDSINPKTLSVLRVHEMLILHAVASFVYVYTSCISVYLYLMLYMYIYCATF